MADLEYEQSEASAETIEAWVIYDLKNRKFLSGSGKNPSWKEFRYARVFVRKNLAKNSLNARRSNNNLIVVPVKITLDFKLLTLQILKGGQS